MKVKPRGIEIPLIILLIALSIFVIGALGVVVYRLGQNGAFESQTAVHTDLREVTTRRAAAITTAEETTATEEEKTTVTEAKTEEAADTSATSEETEAETTATEEETKPETEAPETKPAETKAPKTTKAEDKAGKNTDAPKKQENTTTTTAEAEKDPVALYQKYLKDELVPLHALAPVSEAKNATEGRGLASVMIRDFSNTGVPEMLVIRLVEYNSSYAQYPIFELYGIRDGAVTKLSEYACAYAMSEWNIRCDNNNFYLNSRLEDVNGAEEDLRMDVYTINVAKQKVTMTTDSYTIGSTTGPNPPFGDDAPWVAELTNQLADANRLNEGRLYTLSDYTGLRDWVK